jgi:hypothetical protein
VQVVTKEVFTKDLGVASSMGAFVKALATRFVNVDRELRGAQDQLRAMSEENARLQQQLVQALESRGAAPSSLPPPVMIAAAALPLPPPPGQTASAPATTMSPAPLPPSPLVPTPLSSSSSSSSSSPSWESLPPAPPALVAAMARLWGMQVSPDEAARLIVSAATEAATRLKS